MAAAATARLDAIILAGDDLARVKIAGLTVRERAVRVARKIGAVRVVVVEKPGDLDGWRREHSVLVIRADQLVHTPLVQPLVAALPDDDVVYAADVRSSTKYAGAFIATGSAADAAVAALAGGDTDVGFVTKRSSARPIQHGDIARHPIATAAERRDAHRLLYRILIKPQDNAITRYLYRPVSFPLTRLLAWTPITPNQISYAVAILVAFGCWLTSRAEMSSAIAGTAVVLAASYLDCCDGEIARIKLLSSRLGAWIDTIVDELSSVGYTIALGWHCHLHFGPNYLGALGFDPWLAAIALDLVTFGVSIYCIYYNIIVAVGSANSQDYTQRFEIVPGAQPNAVRLQPAHVIASTRELPGWLAWIVTYLPYVVRRDFLAWAALALAALHLTQVLFALMSTGAAITFIVVTIDHVKLRRLRRRIVRQGHILEAPT